MKKFKAPIPEALRRLLEDFKSHGARLPSATDEFLTELARFRYSEEQTIGEVQKALGFKYPMQVTRLLRKAKERGIINIEIRPVGTPDIEAQLKAKYPGLKHVYTVPWSKDHREIRRLLGRKMAEVFDRLCEEKGSLSVTLGGGKTMRNFVHTLEEKSRSITVSPMALFTRSEIGEVYDSAYLAMVAHWISGESSSAYVCALPPLPDFQKENVEVTKGDLVNYCHKFYHENNKVRTVFKKSIDSDVVIFGVADIRESSSIILSVYNPIGFDLKKLQELGAVADMNYTVLTEDGVDLSAGIAENFTITHPLPKESHPFLLAVNIQRLKDMCQNESLTKDIFVVAGSAHKFRAIRAVLRGKIANCLITDEETAARLVREP